MSGVVVLGRSGIRDFLGIQAPPEFGISFPKSTIIRNMLSADAHLNNHGLFLLGTTDHHGGLNKHNVTQPRLID